MEASLALQTAQEKVKKAKIQEMEYSSSDSNGELAATMFVSASGSQSLTKQSKPKNNHHLIRTSTRRHVNKPLLRLPLSQSTVHRGHGVHIVVVEKAAVYRIKRVRYQPELAPLKSDLGLASKSGSDWTSRLIQNAKTRYGAANNTMMNPIEFVPERLLKLMQSPIAKCARGWLIRPAVAPVPGKDG